MPHLNKVIEVFSFQGNMFFTEAHGLPLIVSLFLARYGAILNSSEKPTDGGERFIADISRPQEVGFLAFLCKQEENLEEKLLILCCFPLHMKSELKRNISSEHRFVLLYGEAKSQKPLTKEDEAFVSLSDGLTLVDTGLELENTPVK